MAYSSDLQPLKIEKFNKCPNVDKISYRRLAEKFKIGWNECNKSKPFFSSEVMNVEVCNQTSGQSHVLQVKNQFINLALSQMEVLPPTLP